MTIAVGAIRQVGDFVSQLHLGFPFPVFFLFLHFSFSLLRTTNAALANSDNFAKKLSFAEKIRLRQVTYMLRSVPCCCCLEQTECVADFRIIVHRISEPYAFVFYGD